MLVPGPPTPQKIISKAEFEYSLPNSQFPTTTIRTVLWSLALQGQTTLHCLALHWITWPGWSRITRNDSPVLEDKVFYDVVANYFLAEDFTIKIVQITHASISRCRKKFPTRLYAQKGPVFVLRAIYRKKIPFLLCSHSLVLPLLNSFTSIYARQEVNLHTVSIKSSWKHTFFDSIN